MADLLGLGNPRLLGAFLASTLLLAWGCGGVPLCARTSECESGSVCGLSGRCERLRPPEGARFAGSRWLAPFDWGIAGADGPLTDAMPVGRTEALLAFGPVPESSRLLRALLVLSPHPRGPRVARRTRLVVEGVGAFRGGPLPARHRAQPTAFAAALRIVPRGPSRPVRFDVTEAARRAGGGRLFLLVRRDGRDRRVWFSSPFADEPSARPRLELMVR